MKRAHFLIFLFSLLYCGSLAAQLGPEMLGDTFKSIALATKVQQAVESKNYVFVAVIAMTFLLQLAKVFCGSKFPSLKKNAAQYSAFGGAGIGAATSALTGGDAMQGAVGGMLVGNAASGLYSSILKPIGKKLLRGK